MGLWRRGREFAEAQDEKDDDPRIDAVVGEEPGDFGELVLFVRGFLRMPTDGDEEVQSSIKHHFFFLQRSVPCI
jgi:hypothetical protein